MVGSWNPKCIISLHPLITDQNILHGIIQGMSHMQLPRNVRRGNDNGKRCLSLIHLGLEIFLVHPLLIQSLLYALGVIGFGQFSAHVTSSFLLA